MRLRLGAIFTAMVRPVVCARKSPTARAGAEWVRRLALAESIPTDTLQSHDRIRFSLDQEFKVSTWLIEETEVRQS